MLVWGSGGQGRETVRMQGAGKVEVRGCSGKQKGGPLRGLYSGGKLGRCSGDSGLS